MADGRAGSLAELAAQLGTDAGSLRLALESCRQLGYLEPADASCATSACGGCPVAGACLPGEGPGRGRTPEIAPTWWRLTDRGARAVRISNGGAGA
jgi:hypothetical protein